MSRRHFTAWRRRAGALVGRAALPLLAAAALLASADAAPGAEQVRVRGGLHDNFARLVFDWRAPVGYRIETAENRVTVTFDRPMEARLADAEQAIDEYVSAIHLADGGKQVVVDLKRPVRTSHFVNEQSVVVDMRADGAVAAAAVAPKAAAAPAPRVPVEVAAHDGFTRIVFGWPVRTNYHVAQKDKRLTVSFDRPGEMVLPADGTTPLADLHATRRDDGTPQVDVGLSGRMRHFRDGRKVVVDLFAAPGAAAPAAAATETPAADSNVGQPIPLVPDSMRAPEAPQAALPEDAETLDVAVKVELDGVGITFPFAEPTALAAFRRGGWIWLVFDRPFRIDTGPIKAAQEFVSDAEQLGHGQATIVRLMTTPGFNASVAREGNTWDVVIAPQLMRPQTALQVTPHPGDQPYVTLGPTEPLTPLLISDPDIGDQFYVVTVARAGDGVARPHQFSDFRLLASVQGAAIVPMADGLKVEPRAQEIVVSAAHGLHLADAKAHRRVTAASDDKAASERIFDFAAWTHDDLGTYVEAERALLKKIEDAQPDARTDARLELARFYFARGMGARARGVLQVIAAKSEETARLATFRALRGAVNYIMGDYADARDDLFDHDFDSEPEIELWRAALLAEDGRYDEATYGLRQSDRFVQSYPANLRKRFAFLGAETALANGDPRGGEFWLDIAEGANLSVDDRAYDSVLRGLVASLDGEIETALKLFNTALNSRDRRSRARAALEKTELLLKEGEMKPEEAIDALDRLRYVWRGDEIEFRVLRRLGELQIQTGKYRDGLESLKRLVTNFPNNRLAPEITEYMRKTFADLYAAGTIESMPPVMAIALFNDFRELAPAGSAGDDMIRRLADRLVSVDLLPQAAALLDDQVKHRLKGADRARVGARLAVIRLLDRDPGEALAALADSHADGIAPDLVEERALISARAYAQLGAFDEALGALAGKSGEAVDKVRGDIMWQKHDWANAAVVFGRLAGAPPAPGEALDDLHGRYVLSRAVALALAGDDKGLATLHQQFAPAMAATPFGADFQVIASVDTGAADFQDVLRRVSVADDFQTFMEGYRARLAQSTTVPVDRTLN